MISIRQSMDREEDAHEKLNASMGAYLATLDKLQRYAAPFEEGFVESFRNNLRSIAVALDGKTTSGGLKRSAAQVAEELKSLWEASRGVVRRWQDDCRSLLRVLADATRGMESRDRKCQEVFESFAERVDRISEMGDLSEIRTQLGAELSTLKRSIGSLMGESQIILSEMQGAVEQAEARYQEAKEMAFADPLTGLPNRRRAEALMDERIRAGTPWCAILLDVDSFKGINDAHGHACGDAVLRACGVLLKSAVRTTDTVCRWAGDEFLIVLDCDLTGGISVAGQIARLWGPRTVEFAGRSLILMLKASSGICQYISGESMEDFVARVDAQMYTDKTRSAPVRENRRNS